MCNSKKFNEFDLINMMFQNTNIDSFIPLWVEDKAPEKWSELLRMCYWEQSYEYHGGDEGYLDDPHINMERIKYLEELIIFLEKLGVQAINNAPPIK